MSHLSLWKRCSPYTEMRGITTPRPWLGCWRGMGAVFGGLQVWVARPFCSNCLVPGSCRPGLSFVSPETLIVCWCCSTCSLRMWLRGQHERAHAENTQQTQICTGWTQNTQGTRQTCRKNMGQTFRINRTDTGTHRRDTQSGWMCRHTGLTHAK